MYPKHPDLTPEQKAWYAHYNGLYAQLWPLYKEDVVSYPAGSMCLRELYADEQISYLRAQARIERAYSTRRAREVVAERLYLAQWIEWRAVYGEAFAYRKGL